jgi:hypothetical protein
MKTTTSKLALYSLAIISALALYGAKDLANRYDIVDTRAIALSLPSQMSGQSPVTLTQAIDEREALFAALVAGGSQ